MQSSLHSFHRRTTIFEDLPHASCTSLKFECIFGCLCAPSCLCVFPKSVSLTKLPNFFLCSNSKLSAHICRLYYPVCLFAHFASRHRHTSASPLNCRPHSFSTIPLLWAAESLAFGHLIFMRRQCATQTLRILRRGTGQHRHSPSLGVAVVGSCHHAACCLLRQSCRWANTYDDKVKWKKRHRRPQQLAAGLSHDDVASLSICRMRRYE